jgi:PadR family transcriptional regulator PadR
VKYIKVSGVQYVLVTEEKQGVACCPPSCCDMRGYLSFSIMWMLRKKDMYGQEVAEELERMRGTKPNSGTLYPALKELEKQGMVETKKEGRKKIYKLTEAGHTGAMEACEYFCSMYGEMFREFNAIKAGQVAPVS